MPSINFYLKGGKNTPANKPAPIIMTFAYSGDRVRVYTGLSIERRKWSFSRKFVKPNVAEGPSLSTALNALKTQINNVYLRLSSEGSIPTPGALKAAFKEERNKKLNSPFVVDAYRSFVAGIEEGTILTPRKGKRYAPNTCRSYRNHLGYFAQFDALRSGSLTFEQMNSRFYQEFKSFLTARDLSLNTIGTAFKDLKAVLNHCVSQGLTENVEFRQFKVEKEEATTCYLNPEELQRIYSLNLDNSERLDRVRDLFLIGCWTGLRFSDLERLTPSNIHGNRIKIPTKKTGVHVEIPVHFVVKEILAKYGGSLPKCPSNQKFNDYLKEVCQMAGLNDLEHKMITKGGRVIEGDHEKWELVSAHTARRSFCTNLYKEKTPSKVLMKITGHKTESAFLGYIRVTEEEAADIIEQSPLFTQPYEKTSNLRAV